MRWLCSIWSSAASRACARAVHLDVPLAAGWAITTFVAFGVSVPSAPGYVGVWHAATVLALTLFGVPESTALGYAILYHASQYVPITLLGWAVLLREHMTLTEATRAPGLPPA